jgi:hypothetical protein
MGGDEMMVSRRFSILRICHGAYTWADNPGSRDDAQSSRDGIARVAAATAVVLSIVGLVGCGGGGASGPVAARIGDLSIRSAVVEHWAQTLKRGGGSSLGWAHGDPRKQALDFLISSHWIIGEAKALDLAPSDGDIERRLADREEAVPNGRSEFKHELALTGQTVADVKLEVEAELASELIRESLLKRASAVTPAAVVSYYMHNREHFRIPEGRLTDLIERIPSQSAADSLRHRLGPGSQFAQKALHELVKRPKDFEVGIRENGALLRAIFSAPVGVIAPPVKFNDRWVLFVVRHVMSGYISPLHLERMVVVKIVKNKQRQAALDGFLKSYSARWTRKTSCRPGFVVQKCARYRGAKEREENPLSAVS